MSFFFRRIPTVDADFAVKSSLGEGGEEVILVGQDLWSSLTSFTGGRIMVSLKAKRSYPSIQSSRAAHGLTCWAVRDSTVREMEIPPAWLSRYPDLFSPFRIGPNDEAKPLVIAPADSVTLAEVVLTAETSDAYLMASTHGLALEEWFFDTSVIIREGEDIRVPADVFPIDAKVPQSASSAFYCYKVNFVSPYRQGLAKRTLTRFMVASPEERDSIHQPVVKMQAFFGGQDESEGLEINESFLVSSALPTAGKASSETRKDACGVSFFVDALQYPIDSGLDEVALYIQTGDLRSIGALNGDWVVVRPIETPLFRLLRVCAVDKALVPPHHAMLSPTLHRNLCTSGSRQIVVLASPFGARDPPFTVARSIALARVASPFSMNRRYESLLTTALQMYFGSSKRLVKAGDIIPLCINVDSGLDPCQSVLKLTSTNGSVVRRYPAEILVYFVVRNIELAFTPQLGQNGHAFGQSDLGCLVDATTTRIVQVGVEQCQVPNVSQYYGFDCFLPKLLMEPLVFGPGNLHELAHLSNAMLLAETCNFGASASMLITGAQGIGKFLMAMQIAWHLRMHLVEIDCHEILSDRDDMTMGLLKACFVHAISCTPCVIVLRHLDAFYQSTQHVEPGKEQAMLHALQQCIDNAIRPGQCQCIVIGLVNESRKTLDDISFFSEVKVKAPNEVERGSLLLKEFNKCNIVLASDISVKHLAMQTAAFVASDITSLILQTRIHSIKGSIDQHIIAANMMSNKHFEICLHNMRAICAQAIGIPSIPTVLWEDIGGLAHIKNEILDTVQLPLDYPELFQRGLKKRSGILLYGPPGTGKTLLAKAVATSCSLNFFSVKGPELLNMYIGESEANVRRVFQKAQDAQPCVIFFDELDSVAPKRGNQGDSGGVMDRIVSQLLAELDGMSGGRSNVFVIGATNRPDLLDPALLRPGRFDKMLYLGVSNTHQAQLDILQALTRKFKLHPQLDLSLIASHCPINCTGADLYALCANAMLYALSRKVDYLEKQRVALNTSSQSQYQHVSSQHFLFQMTSEKDLELVVSEEDFLHALHSLIPSINDGELAQYY